MWPDEAPCPATGEPRWCAAEQFEAPRSGGQPFDPSWTDRWTRHKSFTPEHVQHECAMKDRQMPVLPGCDAMADSPDSAPLPHQFLLSYCFDFASAHVRSFAAHARIASLNLGTRSIQVAFMLSRLSNYEPRRIDPARERTGEGEVSSATLKRRLWGVPTCAAHGDVSMRPWGGKA